MTTDRGDAVPRGTAADVAGVSVTVTDVAVGVMPGVMFDVPARGFTPVEVRASIASESGAPVDLFGGGHL